MNAKTIFIVILSLLVFLGVLSLFNNNYYEPQTELFRDEIVRAGVERVGQPIEGFSAQIFLEAFPGLIAEDFDGVETLEGINKFKNGELKYERTKGNPVTSAEDTISEEGYSTFLKNLSSRLSMDIHTESDVADLLEMLRESDIQQASYVSEDFSVWHPEGWFSYENNDGVFFTHDEDLNIPSNTDGFAMGPYFQITVDEIELEKLFEQNLWNEDSEFMVSKEEANINGIDGFRVVTEAAGAGGEVLHYVVSPDERVFTLSHYPYERGSSDTDDFERVVQNFMINYVYDGATSGGSGILPFESGVKGQVLIGPTCPVQQDPPNSNCADRGYATKIQVFSVVSSQSSPFAVVETDKEGNYIVMLPPGLYNVQALGDRPFPVCESEPVTVESDVMHNLDLLCDSGIR